MVPSTGGAFKSFLVLTFFFIIVAFIVTTQSGIRIIADTGSFIPTAGNSCSSYIVVNTGDTFSSIAQRCGVTEEALLAENPHILNPNSLTAGDELRIPGASGYYQPALNANTAYSIPVSGNNTIASNAGIGGGSDLTPLDSSPVFTEQYIIQPGDTLGSIANAHNITLSTLLSYNPTITNPDVIYPGEVIQIPRN